MTLERARRRHGILGVAAVALGLVVGGVTIAAHPLGTTVVTIASTATAGARDVDVTIDADAVALAGKLHALAGRTSPSGPPSAATLRAQIDDLRQTLLTLVELRSDNVRVDLVWIDAAVADDLQATIRLRGQTADGDRSLTWQSSLVFGSYPVVLRPGEGRDDEVQWLAGPQTSAPVTLRGESDRGGHVVSTFVTGFTHILPKGLDHILFVLGLFLLSARARDVLAQVTAFTLAHSLTLALALSGRFAAPAAVVEPLIALSVAYVGIENLIAPKLRPWRLAIVFGFGLLHGLGFAEALAGLDLARHQFLVTLVSFNVGVEAGQLAVIGAAAAGLWLLQRAAAAWRGPLTRMASATIGLAGGLWTIERLI